MIDIPNGLTLEQALELQIFKEQARQLSLDQAQRYVVEVMRQIMIRDNLVDHLLTTAKLPQKKYAQSILFQIEPL